MSDKYNFFALNGKDLYDVTFTTWHGAKLKRKTFNDVYFDGLHSLIREETGLYTNLAEGGMLEDSTTDDFIKDEYKKEIESLYRQIQYSQEKIVEADEKWVKKEYQQVIDENKKRIEELLQILKTFSKGGTVTEINIGDYIQKHKSRGEGVSDSTQGFVYEKSGNLVKLKDQYGNKSDKWFDLKGFKKSKPTFTDGGKIKNQYKGAYSPMHIWTDWSEEQRLHFLDDHFNMLGKEKVAKARWSSMGKEDRFLIEDKLKEHIGRGQYSSGGLATKGSGIRKKTSGISWIITGTSI